jgi:hypothetical protein
MAFLHFTEVVRPLGQPPSVNIGVISAGLNVATPQQVQSFTQMLSIRQISSNDEDTTSSVNPTDRVGQESKPTPKQLDAERKLYKRLIISDQDLSHARKYAQLILELDLHGSSGDKNVYLHRGLNVALVVSYWRPFSDNEGSLDTLPRLPDGFIAMYSPEGKALHDQLKSLRNRAFAHSDATAHGVRVHIKEFLGAKAAWPMSWNAHVPLTLERTKQLLDMIEQLLVRIAEETVRIQRLLPAGEIF